VAEPTPAEMKKQMAEEMKKWSTQTPPAGQSNAASNLS
jgi:hypothetical protein